MTYPVLRSQMSEDDLIAHFTLDLGDWESIKRIRNESSRLGFAVLLKTFRFLGYPPYHKGHVPRVVIEKIADQVGLSPALFRQYHWKDRLWDLHLSMIREHTGCRPSESKDYPDLIEWLTIQSNLFPSPRELFGVAVRRFRDCGLELPARKNSAAWFSRRGRNSFKTSIRLFSPGWNL